MGFFHGITPDMPNLSSYAEAKKFHDETPLNRHGCRWPSQTKIKHCYTCNGDGSIAFRLYDTECVVWHPDDTITVQGYHTQTTDGFIGRLTPIGVCHISHSRTSHSPMLHLMPVRRQHSPAHPDGLYPGRYWKGPAWGEGVIIKCGAPVTIYYNVERGHYMPVGDTVAPGQMFDLPVINHGSALQVSRSYQLANFEHIARAWVALHNIQYSVGESMCTVSSALREGRMADACNGVPVGNTVKAFGRRHGGPGQIDPTFFTKLRDWIYEHEGVVEHETLQMLTPQQYERYLKMVKRF